MPEEEYQYRVRYTWKPVHSCPSCACEERETVQEAVSEKDAEKIVDRILSKEASQNMTLVTWEIERTVLNWERV